MEEKKNWLDAVLSKRGVQIVLVLLVAAGLAALSSIRYFREWVFEGEILFGDDLLYHLNRIQSMADALKGGQFPVWIYPNVNNGYGYASSLFYPELFLYPIALLVVLGVPLMIAFCLFCWLIGVAMFGTVYQFAGCFSLSKFQRLFAASLYLVLQYIACDIIRRAAMGEALALIFFPVLFTGLWNMVKQDFSKPWILLIGVTGITYSHTISLFLAGICVVAVTLWNAKRLFPHLGWWKKVAVIFGLYLLLTAAYFVPFVIMLLNGTYQFSMVKPYPHEQAFDLVELLQSYYGIGVAGILLLVARVFVKKTEENAARLQTVDLLLKCIVFLVVCTTVLFPWKLLNPILSNVQFPWRLNGIASVLLAVYGTMVLRELIRSPKHYRAVAVALVVCLAVYNFSYLAWETVAPFSYDYIGAGEWMPIGEASSGDAEDWVPADTSLYDGAGNSVAYTREENTVRITFAGEGGETYTLPLYAYYGYAAEVVVDGVTYELPCTANAVKKLVVSLPEGYSGTVTVDYHAPVAFYAAWGVSVAAALGSLGTLCAIAWVKKKRV